MKRSLLHLCAIAFVMLLSLSMLVIRDRVHAQGKSEKASENGQFVRGRLLVKFRDGVPAERGQHMMAEIGGRKSGEIPQIGVSIVELPENASEVAFARIMQSRPEVEFVELDQVLPPAELTPNDPLYSNAEWHLRKIEAPTAWSSTTGNSSITIAILDTGVDSTHPDLSAKMVPGWNVFNNNSDTSDVHGHGTQVAGVAAANTDNALGVASVAWGCKIMPIRISNAKGNASYSDMASGLNWAADNGARVANISYIASTSQSVTSAAKYFQSKGGVVAVAAGNYSDFARNADNPYILTVSATDRNDVLYGWSNTGNNVDLAAPGEVTTTRRGGGYGLASGTSFSAPIVAGVAALVLSARPDLTAAQVQDILEQNADDLGVAGWDIKYGSGRINAARAMSAAVGGF